MKKLFILLSFFSFNGYAQQSKIDSLRNALNTATHDSIMIRSITDIYLYYNASNYDSSLFYASKGLSIARKSKQSLYEGAFLTSQAYALRQKGEYAAALKSLLQAFDILQNPASEKNVYGVGNRTPAEYRLDRLDWTHNIYGELMDETGDTEQAIFHYKESVRIASLIKDYLRIASVSYYIANQFYEADQLDSVEVYAQKSLKFYEQINTTWKSLPILLLAGKHFKAKNDELGRKYLYQALQVATEYKGTNRLMLLTVYITLSRIHQEGGVKDSSLYYAKKAYEVGSEPGLINSKLFRDGEVYEVLYKAYLLNNQLDSVLKYQGLTLTTRDAWNKEKYKDLAAFQSMLLSEATRLRELEKQQIETQSKIRTYAFLAVLAVLSIIGLILYRNNRQKQKANTVLQEQKDKVETTLSQLKATQTQLIQSEKLASLGELTAGIAHEIQNPLNFVNNFSGLSVDLVKDLKDEFKKPEKDEVYIDELFDDLSTNQEKINLHGKRASSIVTGMLEHSRASTGERVLTDINKLADESLRLSYHGLRAKDKTFNSDFELISDPNLPKINVISQDIGRVLINLINNAFYAVNVGRNGISPAKVIVSTKKTENTIEIRVTDNGTGMTDEVKAKIFQPFFTTKPTGQGTGLGLSLAYDIVTKGHGGTIEVETKEGEGTTFTIKLPIQNK